MNKDIALFCSYVYWAGLSDDMTLWQSFDKVHKIAIDFVESPEYKAGEAEGWENSSFEETIESFFEEYKEKRQSKTKSK